MVATLRTLTDELHVHLYGCLTAADVHELGKDRWRQVPERLAWYETEYEKAYGRRPDASAYWTRDDGFERLAKDFEFLAPGPFPQFQACFNLMIALLPIVPGRTEVLQHVLDGQRSAGVRYGEYRCFVPPHLTLDDVRRQAEAYADVALAVDRESAGQFSPRLAFSLCREPTAALAQHRVLDGLLAQRPELARVVTAVDFCGVEEGHPPAPMAPVFAQVHATNRAAPERALAILYHVGESFSDKTLASAARWVHQAHALGAHRLGHAIALGLAPEGRPPHRQESAGERRDHLSWLLANAPWLGARGYRVDEKAVRAELDRASPLAQAAPCPVPGDDEAVRADARRLQDALLEDLAAKGAVIESCPTSNFRIGCIDEAAHHPLPRFLAAGLQVVVSTDDPGVFKLTLGDEEDLCRVVLGLGRPEVARLQEANGRCRSEALAGRPAG